MIWLLYLFAAIGALCVGCTIGFVIAVAYVGFKYERDARWIDHEINEWEDQLSDRDRTSCGLALRISAVCCSRRETA